MDFVYDFFVDLGAFIAYLFVKPVTALYNGIMSPFEVLFASFRYLLDSLWSFVDVLIAFVSWLPIYCSVPLVLIFGLTLVVYFIAFVTKIVGTLGLEGYLR